MVHWHSRTRARIGMEVTGIPAQNDSVGFILLRQADSPWIAVFLFVAYNRGSVSL